MRWLVLHQHQVTERKHAVTTKHSGDSTHKQTQWWRKQRLWLEEGIHSGTQATKASRLGGNLCVKHRHHASTRCLHQLVCCSAVVDEDESHRCCEYFGGTRGAAPSFHGCEVVIPLALRKHPFWLQGFWRTCKIEEQPTDTMKQDDLVSMYCLLVQCIYFYMQICCPDQLNKEDVIMDVSELNTWRLVELFSNVRAWRTNSSDKERSSPRRWTLCIIRIYFNPPSEGPAPTPHKQLSIVAIQHYP